MKFVNSILPGGQIRALLLALMLVLLHACADEGLHPIDEGINTSNAEQFLTLPSEASLPLRRIAETIRKQDAEAPFLNALIATDGFPVWEKSIVRSYGADNSATMALVPLVLENGKSVNSFLACQVANDNVVIKLYRSGDYRSYNFSNALDNISAESIASSFMVLNYRVFGVSTYEITDDLLFHNPKLKGKQRIEIRDVQEKGTNQRIYATQDCYEVMHDGDRGQLVGVPPGGSNDYYYSNGIICVTTIIVLDSPPVFGSGGGSGGSGGNGGNNGGNNGPGGGGSGGGGGGWYIPPCVNNPVPTPNGTHGPMPCPNFQPGWNPITPITPPPGGFTLTPNNAPVEITIDLDDPCLAEIATQFVQSNALVRFMFEQGHYSNPLDYSIHSDNLNQPTTIAHTGTQGGANGYTKIVTTLNTQIIYHLSKEYIMSTLIHEMIHAYRILYFGNTTEAEDHEFMAEPEIFNSMVQMLLRQYPAMDPALAEALMWGGLESTSGFQALPSGKKQSILNTLRDHRNAPEGSRCPS